MTKTRDLANLIADSKIGPTEIDTSGTYTVGGIVTSGNVDGRDVSVDGTKLDGIEASADVTDATNVTAAGALMDSEVTNLAAVKALNQGLATTDEPTFRDGNLAVLGAVQGNGVTHVDVFVYDTSKDSDGGAWRHRTKDKSWYNESSGAKRGSRKEFPAVAVIAITNQLLTIYDADDPDLSMWMVFDCNAKDMLGGAHASGGSWLSGVTALNGEIFISSVSGYAPYLFAINLINEKGRMWDHGDLGLVTYNGNILARNDGLGMRTTDTTHTLIHLYCDDVAVTALPNAPIDASTGLPSPTIAVATNAGVSIVPDNGKKPWDIGYANYELTKHIIFTSKNHLIYSQSNNATQRIVKSYHVLPHSDLQNAQGGYQRGAETVAYGDLGISWDIPIGVSTQAVSGLAENAIGTSEKLILTDETLPATDIDKQLMVNFITSDYQTGWQLGDIDVATLSDTDTTNLVFSELVTNGDGSSTTGWTAHNATLSIVSSRLRVADNGLYTKAYQGVTTVVGKCYVVTADVGALTGGSAVLTAGHSNPAVDNWYTHNADRTTVGSLSLSFIATATTTYIGVGTESTYSGDFDNISCVLAEKDRSVRGKGLKPFGTVTKTAIGTGNDLVAYSGWSTSNYLLAPPNTALPSSATDVFTMMAWAKTTTDSTYQYIMSFGEDATGKSRQLSISSTDGHVSLDINGSNVEGGGDLGDDDWHYLCATHIGGGVIHVYADGELVKTGTLTLVASTSPSLKIGINASLGAYSFDGSIALARVSSTLISPEQVKKIYTDEKPLFAVGAKATLYGSSDAVTAVAYDTVTKEIHAGTSAGRSTFQGLVRTANTTNAVENAISASNGLVAECTDV